MAATLSLGLLGGAPLGPSATVAQAASKPATKRDGPRLDRANQGRLDDLVRFLQDTQNDDGGYGGSPGAPSDPLISAWVGIGLAAAGINPQDQKPAGDKGRSVATYLEHHGPARRAGQPPVTTEFERIGMFVNAAGLNPRSFGGRDYVQLLLARQQTAAWDPATSPAGSTSGPSEGMPPLGAGGQNGSSGNRAVPPQVVPPGWFPHVAGGRAPGVNDTIFAVFFLAGVGDPALAAPIARAATAIEAMQRPDGTWPAVRPGDGSNTDMTGAAVQALCAARRCGGTAVRTALRWLRANQQADGGWMSGDMPDERRGESNSGTTPWVVQALWSAGQDPRRWKRPGGRDPLSFLASLQRREGSIRWRQTRDLNPTWMTAYSAPAFAGHPWPVPAPPRAAVVREEARRDARRKRERQQREAVRDESASGSGGEVASGGGATQSGGGGRGADLFSRPQPQSQGATTGGVRDVRKRQERQKGTRGDRGATGTAAASGVGSDGGVQNGEKRRTPPSGTLPPGEVAGQVVQQPRGTEGTEQQRAIAPGLRSAKAGGSTPPWATIGVGTMFLLCVVVGAGVERRRTRVVL